MALTLLGRNVGDVSDDLERSSPVSGDNEDGRKKRESEHGETRCLKPSTVRNSRPAREGREEGREMLEVEKGEDWPSGRGEDPSRVDCLSPRDQEGRFHFALIHSNTSNTQQHAHIHTTQVKDQSTPKTEG